MARRNLVILLARGLRSDVLNDDGAWPAVTPNLSQLARRGLRVVAQSACPVDPGGLASLLTGLHARQHGVLHDGVPCPPLHDALPGWLRAGGHRVEGVGEVGAVAEQLDAATVTASLDDQEPSGCAYLADAAQRDHVPALRSQREQRRRTGPLSPHRLALEPEHDLDGFIARHTAEAVARQRDDAPWAVLSCFSGPGNDLPPPRLYDGLIEPSAVESGFVPADLAMLDALAEPALPRSVLQRLTAAQVAQVRADYLGRVALFDHGVGRIARAIAARPDARRTWLVIASDRGLLLGERGLLGGRSFVGPAIDVPVIAAPGWGRVPTTLTPEGLFSTVDVATTCADLAGADAPRSRPGRSLVALLRDEPDLAAGPWSVSEFHDRLMIETRRHKAVWRTDSGECLGLYDVMSDPFERHDRRLQRGEGEAMAAVRSALAEALLPLRAVGVRSEERPLRKAGMQERK